MSSIETMWRAARKLRARTLLGRRGKGKVLPPLLFFTDPLRTRRPERIVAALPRGAGVVFRAFGAPDALAQGRILAKEARRRGVVFLVGADVSLAIALRADGLHLPERLAHRPVVRRNLPRRFLVTAAAHGLASALRACRGGVDAVVVSPVFPSLSPSAGRPLGSLAFAILVRRIPAPVFALGGVNARSAPRLAGSGAWGLASIGGFECRDAGPKRQPRAGAVRESVGPRT